jgi:hypothetical protein
LSSNIMAAYLRGFNKAELQELAQEAGLPE